MEEKNLKISVVTRSIYGKANLYIVSEQAKAISQLTRKKTIDENDIKALVELGFESDIHNQTGL